MAEKIVMLALSPTMESGVIAKWVKQEGETIATDDVLCEVETDKATMDYESVNEGVLLKIVAGAGARVNVGDAIGIVGKTGEDITSLLAEAPAATEKQQPEKVEVTPEAQSAQDRAALAPPGAQLHEDVQTPGGVKASPLARELARQKGIDLGQVQGSGPGGRIVKQDIEKAAAAPQRISAPALPGAESVRVSEKRRIIAERMTRSVTTAPHFFLTMSIKMDSVIAARKSLNSTRKQSVSLNAFLIRFVAEALSRHPMMNASWSGETITKHGSVDIGLAVAQKDGLVTPVIRNCTAKGILAIDQELAELVVRAREGKLAPEEYTGATFTISNLGSYGVRQFTAIINPPASAILAIGELFREPVVASDNDQIAIQSTMLMTLSCDHRVIDGAVAAEFGKELKAMLEDPVRVLF